jgi:hypothetical protein
MKVAESGQGSNGDPEHIPAREPDQSDSGSPPGNGGPPGNGSPPGNGGRSAAIWAQVIGASTAVIALIVAIVYGLGAIYLGLKLWYIKDPYTPVLGQLPRSFLLVDAFADVIIPAILAGAIAYLLYLLYQWLTRRSSIRKLRSLINSVVGVAVLEWPDPGHPVIVTAFRDGTARVWDPRGPGRALAPFDGYTYPVVGAAALEWPDLDHPVIVIASFEGTVRVWDPHDPGRELVRFEGQTRGVVGVAALEWPDLGHPVIVTAFRDGTARVWDPHDHGRELARFDGQACGVVGMGVAALAWPGPGHVVIVTTSRDGTARVWDPHDPGRELACFDGHTDEVTGAAALAWPGRDHPVIVTASRDGTARVWDPHDPGRELACIDAHTGSNAIKKLTRPLSLLALAGLLAAVPIGFLRFYQTYATPHTLAGLIRPYWEIYLLCLILSILSIGLAYVLSYVLSKGRKHQQAIEVREHEEAKQKRESGGMRHRKVVRAGIVMGIAAVALIPCISSAAAAIPLPVVVLCGAPFSNIDTLGRHFEWGNMIGTSGQSVYVAVTRERTNLSGGNTVHYAGNYIAVVPLSAVQLETIGADAECNYEFPAPASSQDLIAEANPTFAIDYADNSVGACIHKAFSKAGYGSGQQPYYVGDGVVVFEAGPANPANGTLIDVQTYADGYVADSSALDRWGCQPSNGGLLSGYYVNGQPGTPHWLIQLTTAPGGSISGTVVFVRQGRQTGLAQTFTGHAQSGLTTLTFSQSGLQTALYGSGSISLGSCTAWLKYIPDTAACTFTHSSGFQ